MPDNCYSCGQAAGLYECADGRYRCKGCHVAYADGQRHARAKLAELVAELSADMHEVSRRPCPTCGKLTHELGVPFGCYAYQAKLAELQRAQAEEAQEATAP